MSDTTIISLLVSLYPALPNEIWNRKNNNCMSVIRKQKTVVVVVCPLQQSSSVNSGCPGPESSILVSSRWACPISSQVPDH